MIDQIHDNMIFTFLNKIRTIDKYYNFPQNNCLCESLQIAYQWNSNPQIIRFLINDIDIVMFSNGSGIMFSNGSGIIEHHSR